MARMVTQHMTAGTPGKPTNLSDKAAKEWDRIIKELKESNIQVCPAHRGLLTRAATISADIADAWVIVQKEGAYYENEKTGAIQLHPAARRLDTLGRDYVKVMSLLGLRAAVAGEDGGRSLEDVLNG